MKRSLRFAVSILCISLSSFTFSQDLIRTGVFGSSQAEFIHGYSIDPQGDLVICGTFQNTIDLDFESGVQSPLTASSKYDIYVAKYDIKGNYKWSFNLGGDPNYWAYVKDISTDLAGNIFITGFSKGWIDFDPSEETDSIKVGKGSMFFIAKYSPDGDYLWAHGFGNNAGTSTIGWSVAVDPLDGNVVVCGNINDTIDFDPSPETEILVPERHMDIFLAKYSTDGEYIWAKIMTYPDEYGTGSPLRLQIDSEQNIYMGGYYSGIFDMDPSEAVHTIKSIIREQGVELEDGFLSKYNKDGEYIWSFSIGGDYVDYIRNFRLLDGKLYTVGSYSDTADFDPSGETFEFEGIKDYNNGFMAVYETDGSFHSAISLTAQYDEIYGSGSVVQDIDMDKFGNMYLIGSFYNEVDFDPSDGSALMSSAGGYDMFAVRYDPDYAYEWAIDVGGDSREVGHYASITPQGELIAMGYYDGYCDFDPSEGEKWINNNGGHDVYLAWYYAYSTVGVINNPESTHGNVRIYPNPAYTTLNIESDSFIDHVEIFDISGALIQAQTVHNIKAAINLSELSQGSYIIRFYQGAEVQNMKFVKLE